MKRSAVLKDMVHIMASQTGNYLDAEEQAPKVLDYLEQIGMLPPGNPNRYENYPTVTPTGNHDYSFAREWETE